MRFAEKLYKRMLELGLNQQRLARLSGVSDSEVSRLLNQERARPGLENAFRLARAVGVSLDYLADDALETDPLTADAGEDGATADEREVLDLARRLGPRQAVLLLATARTLGPDLALRRLWNAEKPVIEVGDKTGGPGRPAAPAVAPGSTTGTSAAGRLSSA